MLLDARPRLSRLSRLGRLRSLDGLDTALLLTATAVVAATVVALGLLDLHIQFGAPGLDVAIDTTTTVVTGTVAGLALVRHKERGEAIAIFQAAAFLVFFIANAFALFLVLGQTDDLSSIAPIAASQATPWVYASSRIVAAGLLIAGCLATLRGLRVRRPSALFLGTGLAMLAMIVVVAAARDVLPALSTPFSPPLTDDVVGVGGDLPVSTGLGTAAQLIPAFGFLWAALLTRDVYRRNPSIGDAYLAVGLVFAAGAQVHVSFYPGTYPGVITSGDILRLTFDTFLLLGIYQEARRAFVDLRNANVGRLRLSQAEAENAGLEERVRLSRELHDGLAQSLWLAKLHVGRLGAIGDLDAEAVTLTEELRSVVDTALAEARQVVIALRSGYGPPDGSLDELLRRYADDFSDRFGVEVECNLPDPIPRLGSRVDAELIRIVQEALTNIGKHSDATVAHLDAEVVDHKLTLQIRDNGRGFDPAAVDVGRLGIRGMRERAALIDAQLTVESEPSGGTRIMVDVPLPVQPAWEPST
jgi:signal transduction histidine kinase